VSNLALAQAVLNDAWKFGVREIILCAGARNAPFVKALSERSPFKIYSFFEERSAAFFALGRMQASGRPVAVVTTSGTAAAELLPACIEADHQRLPLVMITADRPRRYRGSGAPQTIIQPGLYSHYTGHSWDIEGEWAGALSACVPGRPVHLNVCFDEPLLHGELQPWSFGGDQTAGARPEVSPLGLSVKSPLVIVGGLTQSEAERIAPILAAWQRPLFIEAPSQLRGHPLLKDFELRGGEASLKHLDFDSVVRVGHVPTLRFWRDLESTALPVYCFSSSPYSGLPRVTDVHPLSALGEQRFDEWKAEEREADRKIAARRELLLQEFPLSEPAWMAWLSGQIPPQARVFLGNSLPIRQWDFAAHQHAARQVFANRGTNGIDGLISTFAGLCEPQQSNWALIGDLSALYDLSGPWALRERPVDDFNLVIINNGGGQIFRRMFRNPLFLNQHDLKFAGWAKMWDLSYVHLENEKIPLSSARQVIEVAPDAGQSESFWKAWEAL